MSFEEWILQNDLSASVKMIVWFSPYSVNVVITLIDFHVLSQPCIPGIDPTGLVYSWIRLANVSLSVIKGIVLWKMCSGLCSWKVIVWFSFPIICGSDFGITLMPASKKNFLKDLFLFLFYEIIFVILVWLHSCRFYRMQQWSHLDLEFCL